MLHNLEKQVRSGARPKYVFFWKPDEKNGYLSQWYKAPFTRNNTYFPTAEHYMMHTKAILFGDLTIAMDILRSRNPAEVKKLGQQVRGFRDDVWEKERFAIVVTANAEKFSQNPDLLSQLKATGNKVLVEASPYDRIWGVGMESSHEHAENPLLWNGLNLLGFALMKVRDELQNPTKLL